MITGDMVAENARAWIGVRFRHQGRSKLGADCMGFVAASAAELGSRVLLDHLPNNYARMPQAIMLEGLMRLTRQIGAQAGAIALIQFPQLEHASHIGILTGQGTIIHCYQNAGAVVEHNYSKQWLRDTRSIWAIPLVAYL